MNVMLLLASLALSADRVTISTGSVIVERPEGRFLFKAPADATFEGPSLSLKLGGVLAALRRPFTVKTPRVVAAVRGTDLYVKDDYVCVCDGEVHVRQAAAPAQRTIKTSKSHRAVRMASQDAPMLYHTDEELARLKAR